MNNISSRRERTTDDRGSDISHINFRVPLLDLDVENKPCKPSPLQRNTHAVEDSSNGCDYYPKTIFPLQNRSNYSPYGCNKSYHGVPHHIQSTEKWSIGKGGIETSTNIDAGFGVKVCPISQPPKQTLTPPDDLEKLAAACVRRYNLAESTALANTPSLYSSDSCSLPNKQSENFSKIPNPSHRIPQTMNQTYAGPPPCSNVNSQNEFNRPPERQSPCRIAITGSERPLMPPMRSPFFSKQEINPLSTSGASKFPTSSSCCLMKNNGTDNGGGTLNNVTPKCQRAPTKSTDNAMFQSSPCFSLPAPSPVSTFNTMPCGCESSYGDPEFASSTFTDGNSQEPYGGPASYQPEQSFPFEAYEGYQGVDMQCPQQSDSFENQYPAEEDCFDSSGYDEFDPCCLQEIQGPKYPRKKVSRCKRSAAKKVCRAKSACRRMQDDCQTLPPPGKRSPGCRPKRIRRKCASKRVGKFPCRGRKVAKITRRDTQELGRRLSCRSEASIAYDAAMKCNPCDIKRHSCDDKCGCSMCSLKMDELEGCKCKPKPNCSPPICGYRSNKASNLRKRCACKRRAEDRDPCICETLSKCSPVCGDNDASKGCGGGKACGSQNNTKCSQSCKKSENDSCLNIDLGDSASNGCDKNEISIAVGDKCIVIKNTGSSSSLKIPSPRDRSIGESCSIKSESRYKKSPSSCQRSRSSPCSSGEKPMASKSPQKMFSPLNTCSVCEASSCSTLSTKAKPSVCPQRIYLALEKSPDVCSAPIKEPVLWICNRKKSKKNRHCSSQSSCQQTTSKSSKQGDSSPECKQTLKLYCKPVKNCGTQKKCSPKPKKKLRCSGGKKGKSGGNKRDQGTQCNEKDFPKQGFFARLKEKMRPKKKENEEERDKGKNSCASNNQSCLSDSESYSLRYITRSQNCSACSTSRCMSNQSPYFSMDCEEEAKKNVEQTATHESTTAMGYRVELKQNSNNRSPGFGAATTLDEGQETEFEYIPPLAKDQQEYLNTESDDLALAKAFRNNNYLTKVPNFEYSSILRHENSQPGVPQKPEHPRCQDALCMHHSHNGSDISFNWRVQSDKTPFQLVGKPVHHRGASVIKLSSKEPPKPTQLTHKILNSGHQEMLRKVKSDASKCSPPMMPNCCRKSSHPFTSVHSQQYSFENRLINTALEKPSGYEAYSFHNQSKASHSLMPPRSPSGSVSPGQPAVKAATFPLRNSSPAFFQPQRSPQIVPNGPIKRPKPCAQKPFNPHCYMAYSRAGDTAKTMHPMYNQSPRLFRFVNSSESVGTMDDGRSTQVLRTQPKKFCGLRDGQPPSLENHISGQSIKKFVHHYVPQVTFSGPSYPFYSNISGTSNGSITPNHQAFDITMLSWKDGHLARPPPSFLAEGKMFNVRLDNQGVFHIVEAPKSKSIDSRSMLSKSISMKKRNKMASAETQTIVPCESHSDKVTNDDNTDIQSEEVKHRHSSNDKQRRLINKISPPQIFKNSFKNVREKISSKLIHFQAENNHSVSLICVDGDCDLTAPPTFTDNSTGIGQKCSQVRLSCASESFEMEHNNCNGKRVGRRRRRVVCEAPTTPVCSPCLSPAEETCFCGDGKMYTFSMDDDVGENANPHVCGDSFSTNMLEVNEYDSDEGEEISNISRTFTMLLDGLAGDDSKTFLKILRRKEKRAKRATRTEGSLGTSSHNCTSFKENKSYILRKRSLSKTHPIRCLACWRNSQMPGKNSDELDLNSPKSHHRVDKRRPTKGRIPHKTKRKTSGGCSSKKGVHRQAALKQCGDRCTKRIRSLKSRSRLSTQHRNQNVLRDSDTEAPTFATTPTLISDFQDAGELGETCHDCTKYTSSPLVRQSGLFEMTPEVEEIDLSLEGDDDEINWNSGAPLLRMRNGNSDWLLKDISSPIISEETDSGCSLSLDSVLENGYRFGDRH